MKAIGLISSFNGKPVNKEKVVWLPS
jgi:hypothetical protein